MGQRGKCRNGDGESECERDLWRKRNRESLKERDKKEGELEEETENTLKHPDRLQDMIQVDKQRYTGSVRRGENTKIIFHTRCSAF